MWPKVEWCGLGRRAAASVGGVGGSEVQAISLCQCGYAGPYSFNAISRQPASAIRECRGADVEESTI